MDGPGFDRLARGLASSSSRRSFLKGIVGTALATGLGSLRPGQADAARCKSAGQTCREHGNCCSGLCGDKDRTGRRKCVCPPGLDDLKGECVDPETAYLADVNNCGNPGTKCPRTRCQVATCVAGVCGLAPDPNAPGRSCDDGDRCTVDDVCQADGTCRGAAKSCASAGDQCNDGACDPATGTCVKQPKPNGTTCDDGDACTQTDTCQNGVCVGSDPVVCSASDQCHVAGTCDPKSGTCSDPAAPNGTPCDDGDACTTGDTCQDGTCAGGNPVVCEPLDECHVAGTCDPTTGTCSHPDAADGKPCNDGNACTTGDTCQQGVCTGGAATVCASGSPCIVDSCDPATGCVQTFKDAGTPCADGDRCDGDEVCNGAGICTEGTPITCAPPVDAQCQEAGICDPDTGTCSYANKENGTACSLTDKCYQSASCQNGVCTGGDPVVCQVSDQCHVAGVCDPATGTCSNPNAPDGTGCDDGNACTTNSTCTAGICGGGAAVSCDDGNACTVDTCNPATGCVHTLKSCNDNNACTTDTCDPQSGCVHTPKTCQPLDQCHVAGTCDPQTGQCSNPAAPSGTSCTDGNPHCFDGTCCADGAWCHELLTSNGQIVGDTLTCCEAGSTCSTTNVSGSIATGLCCPAGQVGRFSYAYGEGVYSATCVAGNAADICHEIDFVNGSFVYTDRPCETGTVCSTADITGTTVERCCPPGQIPQAALDNGVLTISCAVACPADLCPVTNAGGGITHTCCPSDRPCQTSSSFGRTGSACCATELCPAVNGEGSITHTCCPSDTPCKTASYNGQPFSTCCASDACPVTSFEGGAFTVSPTCCPSGTSCKSMSASGITMSHCCPPDQSMRFTFVDGVPVLTCIDVCPTDLCPVYSTEGGVTSITDTCCPSGTACSTTSPFGGLTVGRCCPPGQSAQVTFDGGVASITCAGTCPTDLCPVYSVEGGVPSVTDTCCPSGTACSTTSPNGLQTVGRCCPPGQSAQVTYDGDVPVLTCGGATAPNDHCPVLSSVNGSPTVTDTACDPETICLTTRVNGTTAGQCCPPDANLQVSFDGGVPILTCSSSGACPTDLCPVGNFYTGITQTCCPSGTSCKTASLYGFETSVCCAGDVCPRLDLSGGGVDVDCCDGGQSCSQGGLIPSSGICCPVGASFCIPDGGSFLDQVCCRDGHECVSASFGLGGILDGVGPDLPFNVCCPIGHTARFAGGRFTCDVPCAQPCNPFGPGGGCCNPPGPDCTSVCDHPIWGPTCCSDMLPTSLPCDNPCQIGGRSICCDPGVCVDSGINVPFVGSIGTCSSSSS